MSEQLSILPAERPEDVVARADTEHGPFIARYCLFSGGNDSTVLAHYAAERGWYDELAFIDTTTAVPGVREFVVEFAEWLGRPLRVLEHDRDEFRAMVLGTDDEPRTVCPGCAGVGCSRCDGLGRVVVPLGFPGPGQHGRAYNRLKERQLERLLRETKAAHPRSARVLYLTGLRRAESTRRRNRAAVTKKRAAVFANPLIDWTDREMRAYRAAHAIPQSDVAALLHRSGECNCGAFAAPGEREDLAQFYPEWFEARIASLEREAAARGIARCRWGARYADDGDDDVGELCSDCVLRLDALPGQTSVFDLVDGSTP